MPTNTIIPARVPVISGDAIAASAGGVEIVSLGNPWRSIDRGPTTGEYR
jgi:hypothetical protein